MSPMWFGLKSANCMLQACLPHWHWSFWNKLKRPNFGNILTDQEEYSSCAFIQKVKTKSWNYIFSLFGPKNWLPIQKLVYQYRWQPWLDYCTVPLLKLLLNSHRIPKCPQLTFGVNGTKRPLPDCLLMTFFGFVPNATKSKTFLWIKM